MEPTGRLPMPSENSPPAMTGLGPSRKDGFEGDTKETGSVPGKDVVGFRDEILENGEYALEDGMTLVVARLDESSGENRAVVDIGTGQQGNEGSGKTGASVDFGTEQQVINGGKALEREEQMLTNKRAWKVAVESRAVQYNKDDDIMAIL
ncbi:uncharacterized protein DS421_16g558420 [Arachis hypogaea]|nr:uncharacterized protein DS421_16g558420 [Arachis hypogaea]